MDVTGGLKIRSRERSRFFFFVAVNCLMNIGLTIGQSVSEGLFLSNEALGPAKLPQVFILTAVATAATTFLYASFVDKVRNDRYFQFIHVYTVAALVLILVGIYYELTPAFMVFYGFYYVVTAIFNTHFWNYATDYFDAVEAKRLFPFFPLGNSIGGFLGGTFTSLISDSISPLALSATWLLFLLVTWALIGIVSPRLKGWVVLEAQESDEASLGNVKQGFLFLRRSAMGRWHLAYALVMITSLFFLQYLYSDIFAHTYPNTEELTAFIGRFLAITNIVEVVLELTFTPRLIAATGVGASNMFYPLSTLAGFVLMGTFWNLATAVYSRMNRETFENAISASCRNLLYNAYPARFRGRIRAFIEGAITNVGLIIAGLTMMILSHFVPAAHLEAVVIYIGSGLALVFLIIAAIVRYKYLESLVHGLKDYRLDLDDASLEIEKVSDEELQNMLAFLEAQEDEASLALIARILRVLVARGDLDTVINRLESANDRSKVAAIDALAFRSPTLASYDERLTVALRALLELGETDSSDTGVRARALQLLTTLDGLSWIASYLDDRDAAVRAAAAAAMVHAPTETDAALGWKNLENMLESEDEQIRTAALQRLPMDLSRSLFLALRHVGDPSPMVRIALINRLAELKTVPDDVVARIRSLILDADGEVRIRAVRALGRTRHPDLLPVLASGLGDDSIHVRRSAIESLRPWGTDSAPHVRPLLESKSTTSVDAALAVLGAIDDTGVRDSVRTWLKGRIDAAHDVIIAQAVMESAMNSVTMRLDASGAEALEHARATTEPLTTIAMRDFINRVCHHTLQGLESLEDATVIRNIRRCLEMQNRQARGDAMEALSNLHERPIAQGLLLLLDDGTSQEKLRSALAYRGLERAPRWDEVQRSLYVHSDRWIRVASEILAEETDPPWLSSMSREAGSTGHDYHKTEEYAVMKNLLFLKKVPLFAQMSLEQLEIISRIVTELHFFKGEVIFREQEIGDKLYVIVNGKVNVIKHHRAPSEVVLATLCDTDYFGEMAVLDNEPRSATITVEEDSHLLSISGEKLRDIIHQKPEIAFEIFKVLSSRLRRADQKLSDLARENSGLREKVEGQTESVAR